MQTTYRIAPVFAAACWAMLPAAAHAQAAPAGLESFGAALSDSELATEIGGYSPFRFGLTVRSLSDITDMQTRDAAQTTGSIARITMDVWWASTGADLISANLRTTVQ